MSLIVDDVTQTFEREVLVQFAQPNGTVKQGSFTAEFLRLTQEELDDIPEDERNSDLVRRVLKAVKGIGRTPSDQLSPEESLKFVLNSAECVNAAAMVFFRVSRPERYDEKTSRTQRKRG
ncbi:MAG: hypothetical protein SGI99_05500 [Pseudomonadota bacterium]|nr:hypothetical protein [Pseudomonadota bacterium]